MARLRTGASRQAAKLLSYRQADVAVGPQRHPAALYGTGALLVHSSAIACRPERSAPGWFLDCEASPCSCGGADIFAFDVIADVLCNTKPF